MSELNKKECAVRIYAQTLDTGAAEQIEKIAWHPALQGQIAIMSDAHAGAGCVIGFTGRFADAVIPNIVGVDIGCGVTSVPLKEVSKIDFSALDRHIRNNIPLGMTQRKNDSFFERLPVPDSMKKGASTLCDHIEEGFFQGEKIGKHIPALLQLGTLGGGNHFIEVGQSAADGSYHLIVHSGSRNLGKRIADYYQALAAKVTKQMGITIEKDLAYLPLAAGGSSYMHWAQSAQAYARYNRRIMLALILEFFGLPFDEGAVIESVHNYIAERDNIVRKGAISAHKGERVIIPLNMADGTILGVGKGNPDYNFSAPHGAGRKHGRKEMFRKLQNGEYRLADFKDSMKGVFSTSVGKETFDESKFAYKDPDEIIGSLHHTVEITDRLKPVYNLKASEGF